MTKLLVLTNSVDGTCDVLVEIFKKYNIPIFRWNIDLWQHYEIVNSYKECLISDPTGRVVDLDDPELFLVWRKPFADQMGFEGLNIEPDDISMAQTQIVKWMQSVVAVMLYGGRVRLIEPYADQRLPKLFQLQHATKFFDVPKYSFSIKSNPDFFGSLTITKPLGNPSIGKKNIFYTKLVNESDLLRPYPWLIQEALVDGVDITCVYINGKCFFYQCDFQRGETSIDWRVEINLEGQSKWHLIDSKRCEEWANGVMAYMQTMRLYYGRLDFILIKNKLYFLECNSNGQFGWLDSPDNKKLHYEFADAVINKTTSINLYCNI